MVPHPRRTHLTGAASVLALALVPLFGLSAQAASDPATASVNPGGWKLTYKAAKGQINKVTASVAWNEPRTKLVYLIDDSVDVRIGAGCSYPIADDRTSIRCELAPMDSQDPYASMAMNLRDQNDSVEFHNNTTQVYYFNEFWLGDGKDTFDSSHAATADGTFVWGQNGDDTISTGSVSTVSGGNGRDAITTSGNYSDVDGGQGDDTILAGLGQQYLRGGGGSDVIRGGGGKDTLYGGPGDDKLYGEGGADTLYGNSGDDLLSGGAGADTLKGGPGKNTLKP
ncbi:calcium-binding protein [Kineosporia succinea]|uniref:Ca2+-binding RTX toxin-like protein n=1 Tax=Kineosporia succinea TaxID=84632 RepID=A0ABT9P5B0_9ACTN|nr:hypothetical protein [Kineosporia succinea]MDP9827878.1 Ca2+-binding RTX toxin-like protein [Kineosporia succinea]